MKQLRNGRLRWAVLCVALATATGCTEADAVTPVDPFEPAGPVPDGHFMTDATAYTAQRMEGSWVRYRFTIVSAYQNRGSVPVYLERCFPDSPRPLFSVTSAEGVDSGYDQIAACVGHSRQIEVLPGATRRDTLVVMGPNAFPNGSNIGLGETKGLFQLVFDVRLAPGDGARAPGALRLSNVFRVRIAD